MYGFSGVHVDSLLSCYRLNSPVLQTICGGKESVSWPSSSFMFHFDVACDTLMSAFLSQMSFFTATNKDVTGFTIMPRTTLVTMVAFASK